MRGYSTFLGREYDQTFKNVSEENQFEYRRDGAKYHDENIDQNRDRQKRDRYRQAEIENRQLAVFFDFSGLKIN